MIYKRIRSVKAYDLPAMRDDLGALFARVTRRLIAAERPLLAARGLTMWGYVALTRLARGPAETQLALAAAIGHDKTRLIGVLDALEGDGLITREPDPGDRRARLVRITARGRERHAAALADIRAMEAELLAGLTDAERDTLLAVLPRLAAASQ
jgi:DNA-binding MarR family transcriptional regulator